MQTAILSTKKWLSGIENGDRFESVSPEQFRLFAQLSALVSQEQRCFLAPALHRQHTNNSALHSQAAVFSPQMLSGYLSRNICGSWPSIV
jgi:hypothetical protein